MLLELIVHLCVNVTVEQLNRKAPHPIFHTRRWLFSEVVWNSFRTVPLCIYKSCSLIANLSVHELNWKRELIMLS